MFTYIKKKESIIKLFIYPLIHFYLFLIYVIYVQVLKSVYFFAASIPPRVAHRITLQIDTPELVC